MTEQDNNMEAWRSVVGYEGLYEVSDLGRVKSVARRVACAGGSTRSVGERVLALTTDRDGYKLVGLNKDGAQKTQKVHRLVLVAFVGECPAGHQACHGPGGPGDNRLSQLRWGTPTSNQADRLRDGTALLGEDCPAAKLTDAQAIEIRDSDERTTSLSKRFGVSRSLVRLIRSGKVRAHLGPRENADRPYIDGRGENNGRAKLSSADIPGIRRRLAAGESQRSIARGVGVSHTVIGSIARGKSWTHVPEEVKDGTK